MSKIITSESSDLWMWQNHKSSLSYRSVGATDSMVWADRREREQYLIMRDWNWAME